MPDTRGGEGTNGWNEYSRLVLAELKRLNEGQEHIIDGRVKDRRDIEEELRQIHIELARLQVKAGLWGAMAGVIPAAIALAFSLLHGTLGAP